MAVEIKVPTLGESVTEATVAKWLKAAGDTVAMDEPLVELDTLLAKSDVVSLNLTLGDELSPQATIPGLTMGRHWTVPVYSPLRPGQTPIEILHAEVIGEETIYWEDGLVRAHIVAYRDDPTSDREPRCRLWVDRTGRVLRQEAAMLGARVAFVRQSDADAARLAASDALAKEPPPIPSSCLPEPPFR